MAHLTEEQNERLREAMERAIAERFKDRAALAEAMGRSAPSLSDFLNRKGGASHETVELFAQKIVKRPVDEIIGARAVRTGPVHIPKERVFGGYPIAPDVRRKATVLLKQKPQSFSQEAIDIGFECVVITDAEAAQNPAAVAQWVRLAILGSAAALPPAPVPPSESPPADTRRSKKRAL